MLFQQLGVVLFLFGVYSLNLQKNGIRTCIPIRSCPVSGSDVNRQVSITPTNKLNVPDQAANPRVEREMLQKLNSHKELVSHLI